MEIFNDYIFVSWEAPESDGGSPITDYVVEKAGADVNEGTFTAAGQTDNTQHKVSQLDKGKRYLVQVFAKNAVGQSEPACLTERVFLPPG